MKPVTKRIHRSIFPHTDHGYTWIEQCWYEDENGKRVSCMFPVAGCCERLMHMPGGAIPIPDWEYEERNFTVTRTVNTEETHEGMHEVNSVSIVRV